MVQDRIELGDEYVCVRGVMQHEPGLPCIYRALRRQLPVKCAQAARIASRPVRRRGSR